MKHTIWIVILLLVALAFALAEESASAAESTPPAPAKPSLHHRERTTRLSARTAAPTTQELEEVSSFMKEYSPNRWNALHRLPEGGILHKNIMRFVTSRWHSLQMTKDEDPAIYQLSLKQFTLEDEIYGMIADAKTVAEREPRRDEVHSKVQEIVTLGLTEREQRIQKLKELLKTEEEKLQADKKNIDSLVSHRTDALITQGPAPLRPDFPRPRLHSLPGSQSPSQPQKP